MRFLAVLLVRNEAAFLLEWLAHHQAVGFTDFLVLSNECEDGTDALLDRLDELGHLTHLPNPAPHEGGIQFAGLKRADKHPLVAAADWILPLDVDEFVNIHVGEHTLSALLDALPEATAIPLTWRLFGNDDVVEYQDQPITEQFTRAAPRLLDWPWRGAMFKTLYRNDQSYGKMGVHRPRSPDKSRLHRQRWFDGAGRELPPVYHTKRIFSPLMRDNYALAQINHYPLGAMQSYVLKSERGRAVHGADRLGLDYWVERNLCMEEDLSIARYKAARDANLAALMADDELARLHQRATAWRQEKFESLMRQDEMRSLFGRLLMTPAARKVDPNWVNYIYKRAQSANS